MKKQSAEKAASVAQEQNNYFENVVKSFVLKEELELFALETLRIIEGSIKYEKMSRYGKYYLKTREQ